MGTIRGPPHMHLEVIDTKPAFASLRANWDEIYAADPEAQYYLSYGWFETWFRHFDINWFILGAKETARSDAYVALFPLQIRTERDKHGFYNEIKMAGAEFADYRGFICRPEHQAAVIDAFTTYIKTRNWTHVLFDNVCCSDERYRLFMKAFPQSKFSTEKVHHRFKENGVNNSICPYVALPPTWEEYLAKKVSANTRQKAKRFLKKLDEGADGLRITLPTPETLERDLETLLRHWDKKWRAAKGERTDSILHNNRVMLRGAARQGSLFLPVFWKDEAPLAVLGTLLDPTKKSMHFLITGRDETFNSPPPGFILHAWSIRWGIQNGYRTYDFLQGNEDYKYMFGVEERVLKCTKISTKSKRNLGDRLDPETLGDVLNQASELHKSGKIAEAERGYEQILDVEPKHVGALYLLAQLKATKGDHAAAKRLFQDYLAQKPEIHAAWFRYGKTLQALGETDEAARAYRKVLELDPGNTEVPPLLVALSPLNDVLASMRQAVPKALSSGQRDAPALPLQTKRGH